ncbi:MAG: hypothetical protein PQJ46_08470 [Spirochaetales bacterium]|nr:hypothetical protein [Spirochaetales bacterium]
MKKFFFILVLFSSTIAMSLSASPLIPFKMGVVFPNYDNAYLVVNSGAYIPLQDNLEFSIAGAFGIRTETTSYNNVNAYFYIPIDLGVTFLFPIPANFTIISGVGLSSQFLFDDNFYYHLGPYLKVGMRYRLHPNMQLSLEAKQDLTFGPSEWINTSTQISAGIVFNFDSTDETID